jgi:hypothetical protein
LSLCNFDFDFDCNTPEYFNVVIPYPLKGVSIIKLIINKRNDVNRITEYRHNLLSIIASSLKIAADVTVTQ